MNVEFIMSNFINYNYTDTIQKLSTSNINDINVPEGTNIKDIFKTFKIENFDLVIDFLNINTFIFDINNIYKISFIGTNFINFQFKGLFSEKTILQYDMKNNKFKLIISSFIFAVETKNLTTSSFNLLCFKLSSNKTIINAFFLNQDQQLKLTDLNNFLKENYVSYENLTNEHLVLTKIVGY